MNIKVIQASEIKNYWSEIKSGLEKVLRKTPSATWIPEEVFAAVFHQKALCVVGFINDEVDWGFVGYSLPNRTFFVWAAWSNINTSQGVKALTDIAKRLNCTRIRFETDRIGWEKVAPSMGFRPCSWIKEL